MLQETGNFDRCITADSLACNKCYVFCQRLLQQCDEDLRSPESIVHALRTKVDELQDSFRQCSNITNHNEVALLHTATFLGEHMLSDQAVTFPQLYQKYCEYLHGRLTGNVPPQPRYQVLVYMGKEFGDLMSSVSARNRLGRIMYRAKCDPFLMLSHALGNAKPQYEKGGTSIPPVEPVAEYLNEKVHDLAAKLMAEHEQKPISATFDLEAFASHVAPDLWDAVTRLTHSSNEKLGRKQSDSHVHERKVRIAYIVCVIVFCATGGRCSVPLHTLLTDYIEASGGSSELITVLNRLGAVVSSETLDRHLVRVSAQRKKEGLLKELDDKSFTVATTDNIDFLQSHASVYSGSQHRSWHGTTVQVVQPQQELKSVIAQPDEVARMDMSPPQPSTSTLLPATQDSPTSTSRDQPVALTIVQCQYVQQLHDRRRQRTSPINSPSKLAHSPVPKRVKRARTFHEAVCLGEMTESALSSTGALHVGSRQTTSVGHLQFQDFLQSDEELAALDKLQWDFFGYMLSIYALKPEHVIFSFKDHIAAKEMEGIHTEPAVVVYLSIVDMHADTVEAMSEVAAMLYKEYIASSGAQHLVIAGDAKTYLRLKELKQQYGSELDWLLPFVGDWHVLYNYQKALMKVYYEGGLKVLAMASGYRAETLKSVANASNFKRTHAFLMQVWEAFYRHFFDQYLLNCKSDTVPDSETMLADIKARLLQCNEKCKEDQAYDEYILVSTAMGSDYESVYKDFISFVEDLASRDDTWKFWYGFAFHDCLAYVGLYLAICGGTWRLRMASLKEMCPLFTAFDRVNYLKILPQHFAEVLCLPENIRHCLEKGGFVCNIRGTKMHAVALDEAHEMLVNKDIKTSVVRPSREYLNRIMYYYPVRAKVCKQLKEQISPPSRPDSKVSIFDATPHAARCEENVQSMKAKLCDSQVLAAAQENRGLLALDGTVVTPEQHKDLVAFRGIGKEYHEVYIKYYIVRDPSARVPLRLRRLQTFCARKRSQGRSIRKSASRSL